MLSHKPDTTFEVSSAHRQRANSTEEVGPHTTIIQTNFYCWRKTKPALSRYFGTARQTVVYAYAYSIPIEKKHLTGFNGEDLNGCRFLTSSKTNA
jgi:hypothetical protein